MELRVATNDDIPTLVKMGQLFAKESPIYRVRGFIPDKAAAHFDHVINGGGVIFLAEKNGVILGGFVGGVATDWQSDYKIAFDYVVYVSPDERGQGIARALAQCFEFWAKEVGANRVQCGTSTMVNTEHTIKMYESLGFSKVGVFLEKEI
ncbi:GNAT family N-acetyltransferase [Acinetobacter soli]|uniref:GNAT family N-acetyltransferase n=1 Tax=Acinetobacter soli TaxID=487316 RepID=UPI0032B55AEC